MKILYVTCNPKPDAESACMTVANRFIARYADLYPHAEISRLDLFSEDVPEMDFACYERRGKLLSPESAPEEKTPQIDRIRALSRMVVDCDRMVLAAPVWNLSYPGRLKNFLDDIVLSGETIELNAGCVNGLLDDKERKALFVQSSGGKYVCPPLSFLNYGWNHMKTLLRALGFSCVRLLPVDGTGSTPESWEKAVARGILRGEDLLETF